MWANMVHLLRRFERNFEMQRMLLIDILHGNSDVRNMSYMATCM
jgi:hypothetical protein